MEKITIDQVREKLDSTEALSILPQIALKALSVVRSEDADIRRLEKVISHDQILTTEILKVANSAFYNPSTPIKTLRHALVYLGLSTTRSIILASAMRSLYKGKDEPYNEDLWKHSVAAAIACRALAKAITGKAYVAGEAFVIGLIHDIGKTLLSSFLPDRYKKVVEAVERGEGPFFQVEKDIIGCHHGEVGALVTARWGLPQELVNVIGKHHEAIDDQYTAFVAMANIYCSTWGYSLNRLDFELENLEEVHQTINLKEAQLEGLSEEIKTEMENAVEFFTL